MLNWTTFAFGMLVFAVIQWTLLSVLPMTLTYYEGGMAKRRSIRLGELVRHMVRGRVEMHDSLLYVDLGETKGNVGGHWSIMALAVLLIGPWVVRSKIRDTRMPAHPPVKPF